MTKCCAFALASLLCTWAYGDTVFLKNGSYIDGIVRSRTKESVTIEIGKIGRLEIPAEEIHEIEKNSRTGSEHVVPEGLFKEGSPKDGDEADLEDAESASVLDKSDEDEVDEEAEEEFIESWAEEEEIDDELKAEIEEQVKKLRRQKSRYRVQAERRLKAIGPASIPFLVPLAKDESELVRVAVFRLFQQFGDEQVIEVSIEALTDSNEFVRDYANRTLERVTHEDFGFSPVASPRRRQHAKDKWAKWWKKEKEELKKLRKRSRG